MTQQATIQSILADMNSAKAKLEALITDTQSVIIESDDANTPAPTVDSNNVWTITQDTADTDGVYKGIYAFALNTACSVLNIVSVTGHSAPTGFPSARYTDCADVVHDESAVMNLDNKQVKRFEIYSDTAFTIELTVTATWSHTFDFTVSDGGWIDGSPPDYSEWVANEGWGTGSRSDRLDAILIATSFAPTVIDTVEAELSQSMNGNQNLIRLRAPDSSGTDYYDEQFGFSGTTKTFNVGVTTSGLNFFLDERTSASGGNSVNIGLYIRRITVTGKGANPFS